MPCRTQLSGTTVYLDRLLLGQLFINWKCYVILPTAGGVYALIIRALLND